MTGALKVASSSAKTWGGKEDEDERMKRSGTLAMTSLLLFDRDKMAWCMVGTAVYALAHDKLSEQAGRRLKLISGVVMAVLGLVVLLRPDWLT